MRFLFLAGFRQVRHRGSWDVFSAPKYFSINFFASAGSKSPTIASAGYLARSKSLKNVCTSVSGRRVNVFKSSIEIVRIVPVRIGRHRHVNPRKSAIRRCSARSLSLRCPPRPAGFSNSLSHASPMRVASAPEADSIVAGSERREFEKPAGVVGNEVESERG